ncbi:MAG: polymer-forming cytoskeletal protein [Saprospiraceae bacterium]|nr:polymer-forming cytoskeletal protein [Saprospiraceae bacterium]
MFGSKTDDKNKKAMAQIASSASVNTLVQGTQVVGDIVADSDIRIDGQLEGNLKCSAKMIIGSTGKVKGEVQCANAIIEGEFEGKLRVQEVLNVKETARVIGDIKTDKLIVHSGAVFNVNCAMGARDSFKPLVTPDKSAKEASTANA